jgi:Gram-negative bacterial TonB protein C-terminal
MRPACAPLLIFLAAPVAAPLQAQSMPSIVPPRLISIPTPDCRSGKSCHRTHGQVRLIVDVLQDGKVGDIRVEIGDPVLADAATTAAQQAEFVAGSYLGKPQNMDYVLNFRF